MWKHHICIPCSYSTPGTWYGRCWRQEAEICLALSPYSCSHLPVKTHQKFFCLHVGTKLVLYCPIFSVFFFTSLSYFSYLLNLYLQKDKVIVIYNFLFYWVLGGLHLWTTSRWDGFSYISMIHLRMWWHIKSNFSTSQLFSHTTHHTLFVLLLTIFFVCFLYFSLLWSYIRWLMLSDCVKAWFEKK